MKLQRYVRKNHKDWPFETLATDDWASVGQCHDSLSLFLGHNYFVKMSLEEAVKLQENLADALRRHAEAAYHKEAV